MADCGVCQEALFRHTPDSDAPVLQPVCALACGHTYHASCIEQWFSQDAFREGRRTPTCPSCRHPSRSLVTLKFDGDPAMGSGGGGGDVLLKGKIKRLEGKAKRTKDDPPDGLAFARVIGELGDLVEEELKGKSEEEWEVLGDDPELRNNLSSLSTSLFALRSSLPDVQQITTVNAELASARTLLSTQTIQISSHSKELTTKLAALKAKARSKAERDKQKWEEEAKEKEKAWRGEERRLNVERGVMEERLRCAMEEKKRAKEDLVESREREDDRINSLDMQAAKILKLHTKLAQSTSEIARLQAENDNLLLQLARASASSSSSRRPQSHNKRLSSEMTVPSSDFDESDYGFGEYDDGGVEGYGDMSLEVGDMSWRSSYAPITTKTTYRSSTQVAPSFRPRPTVSPVKIRRPTSTSSSHTTTRPTTTRPIATAEASSSKASSSSTHTSIPPSSKRLKPTTSASSSSSIDLFAKKQGPNMPPPLLAIGPKIRRKAIG